MHRGFPPARVRIVISSLNSTVSSSHPHFRPFKKYQATTPAPTPRMTIISVMEMHIIFQRRFSWCCFCSQSSFASFTVKVLVELLLSVLDPRACSASTTPAPPSSMCTAAENLFQKAGSRTSPISGFCDRGLVSETCASGEGRLTKVCWRGVRGIVNYC